jgi:hypothetical protein
LNKHKARYWIGVGAQPTLQVARLLNKFDFFPKPPVPFGTHSTWVKPQKEKKLFQFHDLAKKFRAPDIHYKSLL